MPFGTKALGEAALSLSTENLLEKSTDCKRTSP